MVMWQASSGTFCSRAGERRHQAKTRRGMAIFLIDVEIDSAGLTTAASVNFVHEIRRLQETFQMLCQP